MVRLQSVAKLVIAWWLLDDIRACEHHAHDRNLRGGSATDYDEMFDSERARRAQAIYGTEDIVHRRLPSKWKPCGTPSPTSDEKLEMGMVYAYYDNDNTTLYERRMIEHRRRHLGKRKNELMDLESSTASELVEWYLTNNETDDDARFQFVYDGDTNAQYYNFKETIPVYFHVMQDSSNKGYVSKWSIDNGFMAALQDAFRPTPFSFALKSIKYVQNDDYYDCDNLDDYKKVNRQGDASTLNVYVCNLAEKGFGGMSFLPPIMAGSKDYTDGITMMNPSLGLADLAHQTLAHETGHWLGLLHTFEGGCDSKPDYRFGNFKDYYFVSDGVDDTPAHAKATYKYKAQTTCWLKDGLDTCPDSSGIDNGLDPVTNYMNYLPADCMANYGEFTSGQIKRMVAEFKSYRS